MIKLRSTPTVRTSDCKYESTSSSVAATLRLRSLRSSHTIPVGSRSKLERKGSIHRVHRSNRMRERVYHSVNSQTARQQPSNGEIPGESTPKQQQQQRTDS